MYSNYHAKLCCILLLTSLLWACASTPAKQSLYERIGGNEVLTAVVDETINEVANNPKTRRSFKGIKLATLKKSVVSQLCVLSGGPCKYEGETMQNAHHDAQITQAEFEVFVSVFREALNRHTGTREKNELLKILAPMKRDIVSHDNSATGAPAP